MVPLPHRYILFLLPDVRMCLFLPLSFPGLEKILWRLYSRPYSDLLRCIPRTSNLTTRLLNRWVNNGVFQWEKSSMKDISRIYFS